MKKYLIVILGPTAIGKTKLAIAVAEAFNAEIISSDSRQFYKELKIGTAAPDEKELATVKHHFVGHLSISDYYNVSAYEEDVMHFLESYFTSKTVAVMVGGSGLYIDAVCKGIDMLPDPDLSLRENLKMEYEQNGIEFIQQKLKQVDPEYYELVDLKNPSRMLRALEVSITTNKPYSSLRKNTAKTREFEIVKIGLNRPREELVNIIHQRVDQMLEKGLLDEVRSLLPFKNLNALNTVGYKELFNFIDGKWSLDLAIEKIKTNTRRYAKRQLTWFRKDEKITWFHPKETSAILDYVKKATSDD